MRSFKWNAGHAVYLPEIDAEHRAIFQAAEALQHAVQGSATSEQVLEVLRGLMGQVEDHFTHEERLMAVARYRSADWHKQQHDAVRKRAKHTVGRVQKGDVESAIDFVEFLSGWLRDHMAVADRMMGAFLRNYQRANAA